MSSKSSGADWLESAAKLLGLAGTISAGMGIPAVCLRFRYLGIPLDYVNHDVVLRAGVLPAAIAVVLTTLFRLFLRGTRNWQDQSLGVVKLMAPLHGAIEFWPLRAVG
jgi:hypothetical protein